MPAGEPDGGSVGGSHPGNLPGNLPGNPFFASRLAPAGQGAPPGIENADFIYIYRCFFSSCSSLPLRRTDDLPCPRYTIRPLFADKDVPPANPYRSLRPHCPAGQYHGKPSRNAPGKALGDVRRKSCQERPQEKP